MKRDISFKSNIGKRLTFIEYKDYSSYTVTGTIIDIDKSTDCYIVEWDDGHFDTKVYRYSNYIFSIE